MRDDQYQRLQSLTEKLADVLLCELDTATWPGFVEGSENCVKPSNMLTKDERGDRYWCKKNAAATLTLINKAYSLLERPMKGLPGETANSDDLSVDGDKTESEVNLDKQLASAERRAAKMLDKYQSRTMN